jgi:nucleoside-diphosphate-sugar epimerase
VTGAAGFIGSHLAEALVARGHEVVGIDALTPSYDPAQKRDNLAGLLEQPSFRFVEGDLADMALDYWLEGADVVFHQAAQPGVRASWGDDFEQYMRHNVLATQRLLEGCRQTRLPRLVIASSSSVYGDAPTHPTREDSATRPVSPYGVTKLATEHLCLAYAQLRTSPVEIAILRYFTVYGPRQRPDMGFRRFIEAAYEGCPITVYGDGEQTRDFTFVSDVVQANILAMKAPLNGAPINIAGGQRVSLNQALQLIGRITGRRLEIVHAPPQPGDVVHTGADGTRASAMLGYRPRVGIEDGLATQAAWVADQRGDRDRQQASLAQGRLRADPPHKVTGSLLRSRGGRP